MLEAKRTLVKSAPELWAELSDPAALARHLEAFGDVRLTGAQDQSLVTWEGERGRGSIALAPSGFGTRVTLHAAVAEAEAEGSPHAPSPPASVPPLPWWAWRRRRRARAAARAAAAAVQPAPPPAPAMSDEDSLRALTAVLDAMGRAHHRPFSRA